MLDAAQRLAVLENEIEHTKNDLNEYFEYVRKHLEEEKKHRAEMIELVQQVKQSNDKRIYFVSGVIAAIAVTWSVVKVFV
jgi:hypothetical protein